MRKKIFSLTLGLALVVVGGILRRLRPNRNEHIIKGEFNTAQPDAVPQAAKYGSKPLQLTRDGTGPLFFRRYRADIAHPTKTKEHIMKYISHNLEEFSPEVLAEFRKSKGGEQLEIGDEYDITILGPWNGSVRVLDVKPFSFTFATLEGHPEAGEIRFELQDHPTDETLLRFEIMSWARSRDVWVHLTYHELGVAKEAQTNTWVVFCERVAAFSGGELVDVVDIITEERTFEGEVIPHA